MYTLTEFEGIFTTHDMKNLKNGTTTTVRVFTNVVPIACPHCGKPMCKNGFTHYLKIVTSIGETMGCQNTNPIEPYYAQRMICRNPVCIYHQQALGKRGGETHVLFPENVAPRSKLPSEDIDLITDIHQRLHDMDEEAKRLGSPPKGRLAQKIDEIMQDNNLKTRITNLCPLGAYYICDFFDVFVFSSEGRGLFKACYKLRESIKALESIKFSNEHPGEQYVSNESELKKISNIIRIHCSHFVRIVSTVPKYSISYMARRMFTSDEAQPIMDSS